MKEEHHLLLIHGFPHDHRVWELQMNTFPDRIDVLAPDLRGFGNDRQQIPEAITMDRFAGDLRDLLDRSGIEKVTLCGLSMGGYVSMAFIDLFPDRVRSLILCNTKASADTDEAKENRIKVAEQTVDPGVAVIARGMLPKMLTERTRSERPEIAKRIEMMMASQRPEAVAAASKGMAQRPDRREWLKSLNIPTTIITGNEDPLMDLSTSEEMHKAIADSWLIVIEGAAHLSNVDRPEQFNDAVIAHFDRLDRPNSH